MKYTYVTERTVVMEHSPSISDDELQDALYLVHRKFIKDDYLITRVDRVITRQGIPAIVTSGAKREIYTEDDADG